MNNLITYPSDINEEQGFYLSHQTIKAGTAFPLHWHDYLEFELILSGKAKHVYNNTVYEVASGSAYMMSYYDFHSLTALSDVELYSIHFTKDLLHPDLVRFFDFNRFRCHFDPEETRELVQKLRTLYKEAQNRSAFYKIIVQNILSELVILIMRKTATSIEHAAPLPVHQAVAYINEHFTANLTLRDLAERLSFSPNYLGQLFREQTGRTFNEYLNTVRLKYACSLLCSTSLTIKEIAYCSGYRSVEYFIYSFKNHMSVTPSHYRQANQN